MAQLRGVKVNSSIIDPAAGVAGLRTLGTGANQAMPGNATVAAIAHVATHQGSADGFLQWAKIHYAYLNDMKLQSRPQGFS